MVRERQQLPVDSSIKVQRLTHKAHHGTPLCDAIYQRSLDCTLLQSQRLAAKAARAGGGAQRSESDADDSGQALGGVPNNSGGANGRHGGLLPSLPDPSAWPFAAALRGDSIADGDERHLQVTRRREPCIAL